ncbi:hypothetical protein Lal_00039764 [Lupinus albus]|nr:hypothetical protein Lal_00039764 [Lupinus albus]
MSEVPMAGRGRGRGTSQNVPNDLLAQMVAALQQNSTTRMSREEETAKICLMVNDHEARTSSKVDELGEVNSHETSSCSSSDNSPTYDELYSAFVELHEEIKKVVKVSVDHKRLVLLREKKITNMQKEIYELKLEN